MSETICVYVSALGTASPTLRPSPHARRRGRRPPSRGPSRARRRSLPCSSSRSRRIRSRTLRRLAHAEGGGRLVEDDDARGEGGGAATATACRWPPEMQADGAVGSASATWSRSSASRRSVRHLLALEHAERARQPPRRRRARGRRRSCRSGGGCRRARDPGRRSRSRTRGRRRACGWRPAGRPSRSCRGRADGRRSGT